MKRTSRVGVFAGALPLFAMLFVLGSAHAAHAQVQVDAEPVFGEACVPRTGGTEIIVGLNNTSSAVFRGNARIESGTFQRSMPEIAFTLTAGGRVTLRLPTPNADVGMGTFALVITDDKGRVLAQKPLQYVNPSRTLFVDATPEGKLAFSLRALPQADPYAPLGARANEHHVELPADMAACPALRAPGTNELVLPRSRVGYTGVSLVAIDGDSLIRLQPAERMALGDYVLAGGTLLLIPTSRDQFRHPTIEPFVGAGVHEEALPSTSLSDSDWVRPIQGQFTFPRADTLSGALGFAGGNLVDKALDPILPWFPSGVIGRSAHYGFGHVHVLSFNPARRPAIEDPWSTEVVARIANIANGDFSVPAIVDSPAIAAVPGPVRRALDPNEGFRSSLGLAVVLLVIYAAVAGPISFKIAARRGRPLRAIATLPVWSLGLFVAIVAMGGLSRSWQGRARRVAVLELPAGMSRGPMRRYRGFFSGDAGRREVAGLGADRWVYDDPQAGRRAQRMVVEPGRARLLDVDLKPWTTTVVREELYETIEGTIDLVPDDKGKVRVINRLKVPLRSVVLIAPGGESAASFAEIPPGGSRLLTEGQSVSLAVVGALTNAALFSTTGEGYLNASDVGMSDWQPGAPVAKLFSTDKQQGLLWDAAAVMVAGIGSAPEGRPALVAQIALPPVERDGDLRVDMDTTFVRVMGWGGRP